MKRDTRDIIAEQAQRIIQGGTPTPDVEVRKEELLIYVDQAFGKMIRDTYYENRAEGIRQVNGAFLYGFEAKVKDDNHRGMQYCEIPSTYVNLPLGVGIYQVSQPKDMFNTIIPVDVQFLSLSRGLLVNGLQGRRGYFVENTKMYFVNIKPSDCLDTVLIKLAGGYQSDDVDPNIDMPIDMQQDLVNYTVQLYIQERQLPNDVLNDNMKS